MKKNICKNCGAEYILENEGEFGAEEVWVHPDNGCQKGEPLEDVPVT